ncbi:MAG: 5'-methylthioadenosine/adenosylhomocysteine nucleosidase [bacterium]|nr:5'-methylthioadenosine/adenosylhomocysteine nucleosidase [bacterium]MDO5462396.1 5'-methylthioadenosine/adenosylhomocysteine nucleosidase [bacterium]
MKCWGILGALDREVALLREAMVVLSSETLFGTTFYVGTLNDVPVVVACCGIGKVNATACATLMVYRYHCTVLINAGIAGAVAHGLQTLDVVISKELSFHDQDAVMLKYFPEKEWFEADPQLVALCEQACQKPGLLQHTYRVGRIATGDVFVNDRVTRDRIIAQRQPDCVEMEGAAIAHVAFASHVPCLVIRTMSDCADEETDVTYDDFLERAADQSANIVLEMIRLYASKEV